MAVLAGCVCQGTLKAQTRTSLFSEDAQRSRPDQRSQPNGPPVVRRRLATANLRQLTAADRASGFPVGAATSLELNLFDDVQFVAQLSRAEDVGGGSVSWTGTLVGIPEGLVILAVTNGVLAGSVTTITAAYEIRWQPGDMYEIQEVIRSGFPREAEPLRVDPSALAAQADVPAAGQDDGTTFDLLVMYTPQARAAAGSAAAITSLIALGVAEANQAYAATGLTSRLRLVGTSEWNHTEGGTASAELNAIRASTTVAALRDSLGADLVMAIVDNLQDACGIGHLLPSLDTGFAPYAFSVVKRSCISPNYSFAHELGHNMGSDHAPEDNATTGAYSFSSGYKDPTNAFRTVMAYDCPVSCLRILAFSSPSWLYSGRVIGRITQDNVRSLANTATTVANFRSSIGVSAPGTPTSFATSAVGTTVTMTWRAPTTGGTPTTYYIASGSSSGLSNLADFSTGSTATSFSAVNVGLGTYYVRVRAANGAGLGPASNESVLVVGSPSPVPNAPTGFITSVVGTSVTMTWRAPTGGGAPTGYTIESGSSSGLSNLAIIPTSNTNTFYSADRVGAGTYYVRVRATNATGGSAASNESIMVVGGGGGGCTFVPGSPVGLIGSSSGSTVLLAWSAPTGNPTTYIAEAGSAQGLSNLANVDLGSSVPALSAPNVSHGLYYIRVRAKNGCGVGPVSNEVIVIVP